MKCFSRLVLLIVLGIGHFASVAWIGCGRSDVPLARVGDKKITSKDLDRAWAELPSRYQGRGKKWLLETLINREVLNQEAQARGLDRSEAVRSQLAKATAKKLTDELFQREVVDQVEVSEEEMRRYFEESGMDLRGEVRVARIAVKTREEAERIVRELDAGGDFAQLARQYSLDQKSASQGGDLGYLREGAVVGPVAQKAFSMEVGSVSEPVRDSRGSYHLITVSDRRPVEFEQQRTLIKNRIEVGKIRTKRWEFMRDLMEKFELEVNDETLAFLLQQGKTAVAKIPALPSSEADRVLLTYRGGSIGLGIYGVWFSEVEAVRRRPNPVDSAQVVRFARTKAVTEVLYPEVARKHGLDHKEAVRSYLERKKAEFMIEELKRVTVEVAVIQEDSIRAYYERYLERFIEPERVFVEVVLAEDQGDAQAVLETCQRGEDMAWVARRHPLRSTGRPSYRVFSFSPREAESPKAGELIRVARGMPVGGWKGPVALRSDPEGTSPPRYAVLHVLERRGSTVRGFEKPAVREEVLAVLRKAKREEIEQAFEHFLTELRKKYENRIKLYADNL